MTYTFSKVFILYQWGKYIYYSLETVESTASYLGAKYD